MTSKEKLMCIKNVISDDTYFADLTRENFDQLEKDLTILDTLKKCLSSGLGFKGITTKEYQMIQEWLREGESL